MFTRWSASAHRRYFRDENDKPIEIIGWSVHRKKGSLLRPEVLQFVMDAQDFETTDSMDLCNVFDSKDAAELMADKMNAFEKLKKQWINQIKGEAK